MKIALQVPSWPPGTVPNGIVTYASYLVPALRRLGHEVFVLTYAADKADPYTVELRRYADMSSLLNRAMYRFAPEITHFNVMSSAIARAIRELVAKHQIDVFEVEESFGWSFEASRLNLVPVVVRLHGPYFLRAKWERRESRNRIRREGQGIRCAHYVTAPCLDTLNAVKNYYGLSLTKSRVVPNPIDAAPEKETWHVESCDTDSLLFVGRFDKVKGGDVVLRAFGHLARLFPKLRLTFVGPDSGIETREGKKYSFYQFARENLPEVVQSRVDFRGQLSHAEVMTMRTKHFITVIAAQYEIMPYMMMEAMSLGCPIVSTAVGGIPEFIKDQRNGLLIPPEDPDAMAIACKRFLEDKALAVRIGRQAWLDCRDLYNSDKVTEQTLSTYREAIDTSGPTH